MEVYFTLTLALYAFFFLIGVLLKGVKRLIFVFVILTFALFGGIYISAGLNGSASAGAALASFFLLMFGIIGAGGLAGGFFGTLASYLQDRISNAGLGVVAIIVLFILPISFAPLLPKWVAAYGSYSQEQERAQRIKIGQSSADIVLGVHRITVPFMPGVHVNGYENEFNSLKFAILKDMKALTARLNQPEDFRISKLTVSETTASKRMAEWCKVNDTVLSEAWCAPNEVSGDLEFSVTSETAQQKYWKEIRAFPVEKNFQAGTPFHLVSERLDEQGNRFQRLYRDEGKIDARGYPVYMRCRGEQKTNYLHCRVQYHITEQIKVSFRVGSEKSSLFQTLTGYYNDVDVFWGSIYFSKTIPVVEPDITTFKASIQKHEIALPLTPQLLTHLVYEDRYPIKKFDLSNTKQLREAVRANSKGRLKVEVERISIDLSNSDEVQARWCNLEDPYNISYLCKSLGERREGKSRTGRVVFHAWDGRGLVVRGTETDWTELDYNRQVQNVKNIITTQSSGFEPNPFGLWYDETSEHPDFYDNIPMTMCSRNRYSRKVECQSVYAVAEGVMASVRFSSKTDDISENLELELRAARDLWSELFLKTRVESDVPKPHP